MVLNPQTPHPQHPPNLPCPRCGKCTVVLHGDSRYVCLSCRWERNLMKDDEGNFLVFLLTLLTVLFLLLAAFPPEAEETQNPSGEAIGIEQKGLFATHPLAKSPKA